MLLFTILDISRCMIALAWARLYFITVIDAFSFAHQILWSFVAIMIFSSQSSESASKYIKMLSFSGLGSITLNRYNYVSVQFGLRSSRFLFYSQPSVV